MSTSATLGSTLSPTLLVGIESLVQMKLALSKSLIEMFYMCCKFSRHDESLTRDTSFGHCQPLASMPVYIPKKVVFGLANGQLETMDFFR